MLSVTITTNNMKIPTTVFFYPDGSTTSKVLGRVQEIKNDVMYIETLFTKEWYNLPVGSPLVVEATWIPSRGWV